MGERRGCRLTPQFTCVARLPRRFGSGGPNRAPADQQQAPFGAFIKRALGSTPQQSAGERHQA